jgi:hypothetical protein
MVRWRPVRPQRRLWRLDGAQPATGTRRIMSSTLVVMAHVFEMWERKSPRPLND